MTTTNINTKHKTEQTKWREKIKRCQVPQNSFSLRFYSCFCGHHCCRRLCMHVHCTISSTSVHHHSECIFSTSFFVAYFVRRTQTTNYVCVCELRLYLFPSSIFCLFCLSSCFSEPRMPAPPLLHTMCLCVRLLYKFACILILIAHTFHQYSRV